MQKKANLHTHTCLCGHAEGKVIDYCEQAVQNGVGILGISDHCPMREVLRDPGHRMGNELLPEYAAQIREARKAFPELRVLSGFEIDYSSRLGTAYYEDVFFHEFGCDYCIGGVHFLDLDPGTRPMRWVGARISLKDLEEVVKESIFLMETGLIDCLVHPDIALTCTERFTEEHKKIFRPLMDASIELDIPMEINANGMRKGYSGKDSSRRYAYPYEAFWEFAAECGVRKVVTGSDAHRPDLIWDHMDACEEFAASFGLEVCNWETAEKILERKKAEK